MPRLFLEKKKKRFPLLSGINIDYMLIRAYRVSCMVDDKVLLQLSAHGLVHLCIKTAGQENNLQQNTEAEEVKKVSVNFIYKQVLVRKCF